MPGGCTLSPEEERIDHQFEDLSYRGAYLKESLLFSLWWRWRRLSQSHSEGWCSSWIHLRGSEDTLVGLRAVKGSWWAGRSRSARCWWYPRSVSLRYQEKQLGKSLLLGNLSSLSALLGKQLWYSLKKLYLRLWGNIKSYSISCRTMEVMSVLVQVQLRHYNFHHSSWSNHCSKRLFEHSLEIPKNLMLMKNKKTLTSYFEISSG